MYCPDCYEEWHASAPEKQGVLDLRENTYLAKAIGYITNAFSKNKSRIKVHRSTRKQGLQTYYFTKDAKHCVCIEYDNAFKLQNTPEIQLSEVPECILVLLTYLKN